MNEKDIFRIDNLMEIAKDHEARLRELQNMVNSLSINFNNLSQDVRKGTNAIEKGVVQFEKLVKENEFHKLPMKEIVQVCVWIGGAISLLFSGLYALAEFAKVYFLR